MDYRDRGHFGMVSEVIVGIGFGDFFNSVVTTTYVGFYSVSLT